MSLTAGVITKISSGQDKASLSATAASGGSGPYTQQWYRSTTTGFSPGGGNIIAGATALTLNDTGLIPSTPYFYKVVYTDTGNSNVTVTSAQLALTTDAPGQSPNAFLQSALLGMLDQRFNYDTIAAEVDSTQATPLLAGQAVKVVDSADGVPKVIACAANSDEVFGFINYDVKSRSFAAGAALEISQSGNVMYLYAVSAIARGAQVQLDVSSPGAVSPATGSSGADIVGWALDKATSPGQLIRVRLGVPSFLKA